ncbi:MAG: DUF2271 domain-containing protein [Flavobacteriales bacterium]|nr:DUF2271 domain-containing protein [Flavobacteriales bacterium]
MKQPQIKSLLTAIAIGILSVFSAQTAGSLSFTFTQTSHTAYTANKNVMAVWIQSSNGTFIKTRMRNAGSGTKDHLPTWAVNSGGTSGNCMSTSCNTVGATTGATLTSFSTRTVTWDGTDVNGNLVADGTYKITIESCWNHGSGAKTTRSFTFTKGSSTDSQTPADDANFTNISLAWTPSNGADVDDNEGSSVRIYPNPSSGIFNINYSNADAMKVLDILGNVIYSQRLSNANGLVDIDLSSYENGVYFVVLGEGDKNSMHKILLNK